MEGVMVSAFDEDRKQSISVFSQSNGSFTIDGLRDVSFNVRARLMGQLDVWQEDVDAGATGVSFAMRPAKGEDLEIQRTADSGFSMLKWDSIKDKENYKMMCTYCHQTGSRGWRTPEKPVDWQTMIRRMDGFGGLYKHTQQTLIKRLVETYNDDAVAKWPAFVPPPAPKGAATQAKITEWDMGKQFKVMIHDLELGPDGLVYAVDMAQNAVVTLDPATGERELYRFPGRYRGPHSIELGNDGNMWFTLCISGEMAKFDLKTKEFTITSSAVAPARRGSYPHTLRISPKDPEGLIWYTDAGRNSCFSLHPETLFVKKYNLLRKNQAVGAGKGESRGITPYGIDISPVDGTIWYSKLNGNRIGRIDPNAEDGDIKEWNPPFRGPRRLHIAQDGIVWVPGFGSGVFGKFDPKTEEWKVYDLPDAENQIPYALNIDPQGNVWICGTNNDVLYRFDPKTEELVEFRLPSRVTYTREIEFDADGNIWTCNSNGPARHTERGYGSIIKLEIVGDHRGGGIRLSGKQFQGEHSVGIDLAGKYQDSPNGKLLLRIEGNDLPKGYNPGRGKTPKESAKLHQDYVDRRMAKLSSRQRARIGRLWAEKRKADPDMPNAGQSFVRIMEYVAANGK
jgi:streptogramin lyase